MTKWIPCGDQFVEADVVRWHEPIWKEKRSHRSKSRQIGEREITAQVVSIDEDGWATFTVMHCVSKHADDWAKELPQLKTGQTIRRNPRATLAKGRAERAPWGGSDGESARVSLTSKFGKVALPPRH